MNKHNTKAFVAIIFALLGMVGLYNHIEYSGWLLFVAIVMGTDL